MYHRYCRADKDRDKCCRDHHHGQSCDAPTRPSPHLVGRADPGRVELPGIDEGG